MVHILGDVTRFASSKQAVAFTGLDPLERSSVGKVRKASISKAGNTLLRQLLEQTMHVAVRYDSELKTVLSKIGDAGFKTRRQSCRGRANS
jgi:transposase